MSSIVKDIFEGVENTVKGAFDGDIGSIVALGAMAYGGFMAGEAAGWWGASEGAIGTGSELTLGSTDALSLGSSGAPATTAGGVLSDGGITLAGGETAAGIDTVSSIDAAGTMTGAGNTATAINAGESTFLNPVNVNSGLLDLESANISVANAPSSSPGLIEGFFDSKYAMPAALIGGNVLSSGISAAEQRRIEEERIKERNQEQSGGYTRSGKGNIDLKIGERVKSASGSYRRPNAPGRYQQRA